MSEVGMQCPRCGDDFRGEDPDVVTDAVLAHAETTHHHAIDRNVVLAHLAGVRPDEYDGCT